MEELRAKLPEHPSSVPLNPGEVIVLRDVAVTVRHMRAPRGEREPVPTRNPRKCARRVPQRMPLR